MGITLSTLIDKILGKPIYIVCPKDHNPKLHLSVFSLLIFYFIYHKNKKLSYSFCKLVLTLYALFVMPYFLNIIRSLNRVNILDSTYIQLTIFLDHI